MNADDRLSLDPLGRVEGGNRIVESSHFADVCPQPTNPDPLDELTQLGAIGYDDEVDSQAARGPRLGRAGDGHQRSSGANQARRPLPDIAADDIENQIDFADIFQGVVIEVDELLCAEVESRLTAGSAPGADDVRAGLTCELARHRTDYAGRTVHEDALPHVKAAVLEQPLPRGQARHHEGRAHREINVARQLGPLHQLHPGRSRSLIRHHNRLHRYLIRYFLESASFCSCDGSPRVNRPANSTK